MLVARLPVTGRAKRSARPVWHAAVPRPPGQNYTIPVGATVVSTQAQLETELAKTTAEDIKILNGSYTRTGPISPAAGHRLWCETYNGVTFNYGFQWAYKSNWQINGGVINLPSASQGATDASVPDGTACIMSWPGSGINASNGQVRDVTVDGNDGAAGFGFYCGQPNGAIIERFWGGNFKLDMIWASNNNINSTAVMDRVWDVNGWGCYDRSNRGVQNGEDEYVLVVGHRVTNGVHRIRARDCGWAGILTITKCEDTEFRDIDCDVMWGVIPPITIISDAGKITGQGFYWERHSRRCTLSRFRFGCDSGDIVRGIASEWDKDQNYALTAPYVAGADTTLAMDFGSFSSTLLPATGTVYITEAGTPIAYTGVDATNKLLTGVSGGSGTYATGTLVSARAGGMQASTDITMKQGRIVCRSTRAPQRTHNGITMGEGTIRPAIIDVRIAGLTSDGSAVVDHSNTPDAINAATSQLAMRRMDSSGRVSGSGRVTYRGGSSGGA